MYSKAGSIRNDQEAQMNHIASNFNPNPENRSSKKIKTVHYYFMTFENTIPDNYKSGKILLNI